MIRNFLLISMIFSTWNVHGAFSCLSQIFDVVEFSDIVFISEHWLPDICLPSLNTTFGNHISYIANPGITTNNITRGGVAFILKNSEQYSIKQTKSNHQRILALEITFGSHNLFIIGCLLPSTNLPFSEYKSVLCDVFDLYDELCELGPVILCGDFNTDIKNKPDSLKSRTLAGCLDDRNLWNVFQSDHMFSFQTKDKSTKTLLDYFFVPEWMASEIIYKEIYEKYEYDVSDHLPLFTEINMKIFFDDHSYNISRNIPRWQNANSDDIQNYRNTSENLLKRTVTIMIPYLKILLNSTYNKSRCLFSWLLINTFRVESSDHSLNHIGKNTI